MNLENLFRITGIIIIIVSLFIIILTEPDLRSEDISSFSMITPNVCIYGNIDNNLSCGHNAYGESSACSVGICSQTGKLSNEDNLSVRTPLGRPANISFNLTIIKYFGTIPLTKENRVYSCQLNFSTQQYHCKY